MTMSVRIKSFRLLLYFCLACYSIRRINSVFTYYSSSSLKSSSSSSSSFVGAPKSPVEEVNFCCSLRSFLFNFFFDAALALPGSMIPSATNLSKLLTFGFLLLFAAWFNFPLFASTIRSCRSISSRASDSSFLSMASRAETYKVPPVMMTSKTTAKVNAN